ncbi:hypothetical protein [Methylobacterium sp. Leaf99]|uniref:hypothetical protein n=1 Tax=Methylobacterium sp. Leaf99 TaxID=1736251 RepID=UPI0012EE40E6|nr:hypothetical protein [Methylobacterium sp. Leaf99]
MKNSNSYRPHFLRREGERACDIRNPIVALENVSRGWFNPRRPDPGETYPFETCFNSERELNNFLLNREQRYVDHDKLFRDQELHGIDPYYEFVAVAEDSEACIQPGAPSLGGWQRQRAFHHCVEGCVLEMRSKLLLAAEFRAVCRDPIAILRSPCPFDTDADLDEAVARVMHKRKHLWTGKRVNLPAGAPRFYREAQLWQHSRP